MAKTPWIVPIMPRASEDFGSFGTPLLTLPTILEDFFASFWRTTDFGSFVTSLLTLPTILEDFFASFWRTTAAGFAKSKKKISPKANELHAKQPYKLVQLITLTFRFTDPTSGAFHLRKRHTIMTYNKLGLSRKMRYYRSNTGCNSRSIYYCTKPPSTLIFFRVIC
jgi:hypothetical protein